MNASARMLARARFHLFGTEVHVCAGCYGPPHMVEDRAFLYRYTIGPEQISPPVCSQACIEMALRRAARKPIQLSPAAQALLNRDRRDFAEEKRLAREAAAAMNMARLRALGEDAVAKAMAGVIIDRTAGQEACERAHLIAAGFTAEEITRLGPAAVARAAQYHPSLRG